MWVGHRKEIRDLTFRALWVALLVGAWYCEKQEVKWKVFDDAVRIKTADFKNRLLFQSLQLSVLPWCRGRLQTAICCLEWVGRLKCLATGLDALLPSFSRSRRCSRNRSPSRFHVPPMYNCFAKSPSYAVYDIGWETGLDFTAFHSTNLFCVFSRYQASTNSVAPSCF